ncbi:hypothetical protein LC087_18570 [Bacillus carboniphilus]|uniref:DUF4901 domain-containing protein n=1 Tax=Bacillus carboniphilus TaxID=86663 RepID=A0ABY9JTF0_9BACI|nr:hypothetical protein [Bacillus carboniphilus]WLR42655.1 hypothetical protein LC087_18570 [Bacillus carboniphilus]
MDERMKRLIDKTKLKLGLDHYTLFSYDLTRNVNVSDTSYSLSMEWFPNPIRERTEDDCNPPGTACVDIDFHTGKFHSVIFVEGQSVANGVVLSTKEDMITWVENETGLLYGKQFKLIKEEDQRLLFHECVNGIPFAHSGSIEIRCDDQGNLTFFSESLVAVRKNIKKEKFSLSVDQVEHLFKEQLILTEFPDLENEKFKIAYGIEEVYVTNDQLATIPSRLDERMHYKINELMEWDTPIEESFHREEIDILAEREVTVQQALNREPHPDLSPITEQELDQCKLKTKDFLRQVYPNESGEWKLIYIVREGKYFIATVKPKKETIALFERKINIFVDVNKCKVINYIDNEDLVSEICKDFQPAETAVITKEQAYDELKDLFKLSPYYVYDFERKQYMLCGKLDCQYVVMAHSGEVVIHSDL